MALLCIMQSSLDYTLRLHFMTSSPAKYQHTQNHYYEQTQNQPLFTGILKLTTNGKTVQTNREYQLNVSCDTFGTQLLEKVFSVTFTVVSTTMFSSTKSTSEMVTTDLTTISPTISTIPVNPTTETSREVDHSSTPHTDVFALATTKSTGKQVTVASTFTSVGTSISTANFSSTAIVGASATTFTHTNQATLSTSFFDDPVNIAIISVVAGLALLGTAAIGCSVLALRFCKKMPAIRYDE